MIITSLKSITKQIKVTVPVFIKHYKIKKSVRKIKLKHEIITTYNKRLLTQLKCLYIFYFLYTFLNVKRCI